MSEIVALTGHRPDKLGGFNDMPTGLLQAIAENYLTTVCPKEGITGMALGWDTIGALAFIRLGIPFTAAVPFLGQESKWQHKQRNQYQKILSKANQVVIVSQGGFAVWKMHERNKWMVDHATRMCAMWNGSPGGTGSCLEYAKKVGRQIDNLWDEFKGL